MLIINLYCVAVILLTLVTATLVSLHNAKRKGVDTWKF